MKHTIRIQSVTGETSEIHFSEREDAAHAFDVLSRQFQVVSKFLLSCTLELHLAADTDNTESKLEDILTSATWIVRLFGTHDPQGKTELQEEVRKLRTALREYKHSPKVPMDDPRDTNLETDCAPSYSVEYTSPSGENYRYQHPARDREHALHLVKSMQVDPFRYYRGPYRILETRVIHSEP